MKQPLDLSGRRLTGVAMIAFGLLFSSFALANIISGNVSTNSSVHATYTLLTLDKPSSVVPGDVLVANIVFKGGTPVNVTAPSGWTQIVRTDNDTDVSMVSYWKTAGASEPSNFTWTLDTQTRAEGGITQYSGVDPVNPIDIAAGNFSRSKIATTTPITTGSANEEVVALFGFDAGTSTTGYFSTPAGMTEKYDVTNATAGPSIAADDAVQVAAGSSGSMSSTIEGNKNRNWVSQAIALRRSVTIAFAATSTPSNSGTYTTDTGMTGNPISVVGNSTLLLVTLWSNPGLSNPAVSCNGVPMSLLESGADTGTARAYTFALRGATSCAPVATWDSSFGFKYMMAVSYTGVDQTADPVTFNNQNNPTTGHSSTATLSADSVPNSWIVTFADNNVDTFTGMTNGTIRIDFPGDGFMTGDSNGTVVANAPYSTALSYPGPNNNVHVQQVEISPAQ